MLKIPFLILLLVLWLNLPIYSQTATPPKTDGAEKIKSFQSDGCTMWFDGEYRGCCEAHDAAYFRGGGWRARLQADNRLYRCVANIGITYSLTTAPVMWLGVRVFGSPLFPIHKKRKIKATK